MRQRPQAFSMSPDQMQRSAVRNGTVASRRLLLLTPRSLFGAPYIPVDCFRNTLRVRHDDQPRTEVRQHARDGKSCVLSVHPDLLALIAILAGNCRGTRIRQRPSIPPISWRQMLLRSSTNRRHRKGCMRLYNSLDILSFIELGLMAYAFSKLTKDRRLGNQYWRRWRHVDTLCVLQDGPQPVPVGDLRANSRNDDRRQLDPRHYCNDSDPATRPTKRRANAPSLPI